jgi:fatty acid desaturase
MNPAPSSRKRRLLMILLALVILVPALLGFGKKFLEFLALIGDEEGSFAVAPVLNYLLASLGFLLLFFWAIFHGMFRDIEKPKHDMLEREHWLEEAEARRRQELWED